jgi:AAA+ ATPase superfamily predicted ATPase
MAEIFVGRKQELDIIRSFLESTQQILLVYGRRRIGKTKLIEVALKDRKSLFFEGLENEPTSAQIYNFIFQFEQQSGQVVKDRSKIKTWSEALIILRGFLQQNPGTVVVLDELQWMANRRGRMISELKMIWERYLGKISGAKLILSGSIASFMVKKVLRSKALFGRIDRTIHLRPLLIKEVRDLFVSGDPSHALLAYLFVGGIPKYLRLLADHKSAIRGIAQECFSPAGYFREEFERIFVSHFGRSTNYLNIVSALKGRFFGLSRRELEGLKVSQGGGQLSDELFDLEQAGFITCFVPFDKRGNSKYRRYILSDPFLSFHLSFMNPTLTSLRDTPDRFISTTFVSPAMNSWLGHSFEVVMLQHADRIAEILGFSGIGYSFGPYFRHNKGGTIKGAQLDMVFNRADKVYTVCEMKYLNAPVPLAVGRELAQKLEKIQELDGKIVQRVVISNQPASQELEESGLVSRVIEVKEL